MSQQALDFGRDHRVAEAHRSLLRILNDVVDAVGLLQCAGACGCRTSELSDALAGRSNRYLRIEWLAALLDIAPVDFRYQILSAIANPAGYTATPLRPKTAAERLADLETKVAARFGAAGVALLEEEQGTRR